MCRFIVAKLIKFSRRRDDIEKKEIRFWMQSPKIKVLYITSFTASYDWLECNIGENNFFPENSLVGQVEQYRAGCWSRATDVWRWLSYINRYKSLIVTCKQILLWGPLDRFENRGSFPVKTSRALTIRFCFSSSGCSVTGRCWTLCNTHSCTHTWMDTKTNRSPHQNTHTHTHTETHTHTRMYTIIICTFSLSNILTRNLLFMKSIGCRLDPPLPRKPTLSQTWEQTTRHITTDCSRHPEKKAHNIADRDLIKHRQYCRQKLEQKTTVQRLECLDSRNCSFSWNKFFFCRGSAIEGLNKCTLYPSTLLCKSRPDITKPFGRKESQ